MNIRIVHENLADHPDYDVQVAQCGARHGLSLRQWSADVWFCEQCGHRVGVEVIGVKE